MGAKHSKRAYKASQPSSSPSISSRLANTPQTSSVSSNGNNKMSADGRVYHNVESSTYILPQDEEEQDRLNSQHFAAKVISNGNILKAIADNLPQEAIILDIGCGSGSWVMDIAIDYPGTHVTGIDIADIFPTTIRPKNVDFKLVNVLDGLPFPDNTFDFVHMRLLIVAFRRHEWNQVINEIYRVLKPGGYVQLVESQYTDTEQSPKIKLIISALISLMEDKDQDPMIGSKLEAKGNECGFETLQKECIRVQFSNSQNAGYAELLWAWGNAMKALKQALAPRVCPEDENAYDQILSEYLKDCTEYGNSNRKDDLS
ncbi:S-adenosyl-L-methionine-dependent methyltransferase [Phycomyces nitens]|nr:S-adenosyl-L-methionine-dependent methyltransferase [Phycomyces nitens]